MYFHNGYEQMLSGIITIIIIHFISCNKAHKNTASEQTEETYKYTDKISQFA